MANKTISNHGHETLRVSADFAIRDKSTYFVDHPVRVVNAGINVLLHEYGQQTIASASSTGIGSPDNVFQNNPNGGDTSQNALWGTGWNNHNVDSATPGRLLVDLGHEVALDLIEWQGEADTGYGAASGPNSTTLRFSRTPMPSGYNSAIGQEVTQAKSWSGAAGIIGTTVNGLDELYDAKAANGNVSVLCRYIAIDCHTSHDTRNMSIRHILLHTAQPADGSAIVGTVAPNVRSFTIVDGTGNQAGGSHTNVVVGADNVLLSTTGRFDFVEDAAGTGYVVNQGERIVAEVLR